MKRKYLLLGLLLLFLAGLAAGAAGQSSTFTNIRLQWNVIVGGGSQSSSTGYLLDGTVSESLVGPPAASSANYQLTIGYSTGGIIILSEQLYLPLVVGAGP